MIVKSELRSTDLTFFYSNLPIAEMWRLSLQAPTPTESSRSATFSSFVKYTFFTVDPEWKRLSPVKGIDAARRMSREEAHARR